MTYFRNSVSSTGLRIDVLPVSLSSASQSTICVGETVILIINTGIIFEVEIS